MRSVLLFVMAASFESHLLIGQETREWPPPSIAGIWLVDSYTYRYRDGTKFTQPGDRILVVLPKQIVFATIGAAGLKRSRNRTLVVVGEESENRAEHLVLCKDILGQNVRAVVTTDSEDQLRIQTFIRPPKNDTIVIGNRRIRFEKSNPTVSISYNCQRAKAQDWGGIIREQLASGDDFGGDKELLETVELWLQAYREPSEKFRGK